MKAFLALALLLSFSAHATQLLFKLKNKDLQSVSIDSMKAGSISRLSSSDVTLYNPDRGHQLTYQGYDLFALLDFVYGKTWRTQKKITFITADGSSQNALISEMIKAAQGRKGHLAFAETGTKGFTFVEKNGHRIDPAPLYLVWNNFTSKTPVSSLPALKWPYQIAVISID